MIKNILTIAMLFSSLAGVSAQGAWTASTIADSLKREAYSVVRDYQTTVTATTVKQLTRHHRLVVTVLNKKGDNHGAWSCSTNKFDQLSSFSGKVYDETGKVIQKLKRSDVHTSQYSENLATDVQHNYVHPPVANYPYTVEYEWEEKCSDGYVEYDFFAPVSHDRQALEKAVFTVSVPTGTEIRNMSLPCSWPMEKKPSGKEDVYVWTMPAMKGIVDDAYDDDPMYYMPAVIAIPLYFQFGESTGVQDSWENKGAWYAQLAEGRDLLLPSDKQKVQELTSGCNTDYEKIAALYKYLGEKTRYVSIQLGIGGWQPMTAEEVGKTGFGDCKALTNYMQALLKEAGITSYQTIISTEYEELLKDFPNMHQTDHVVLTIPQQDGKDILVECTNPQLPLGFVSGSYAGHEALLVKDGQGQLVRIPGYTSDNNYETLKAEVTLEADGKSFIKYSCDNYGARYGRLRFLVDRDDKERKNVLTSWVNLSDPVVENVKVEEDKSATPHVNVSLDAKATYGKVSGSRLFITCNPFFDPYVPRFRADRSRPIVVDEPYTFTDELQVNIPEGYVYKTGESSDSSTTDFGSYSVSTKQEGSKLLIKAKVVINKGRFDVARKADFLAFREGLYKVMKRQIILEKQSVE